MYRWVTGLGGTKNLLSWGILATTTTLLATGAVDQGTWATVVLGSCGAYIAGNVMATYANAKVEAAKCGEK